MHGDILMARKEYPGAVTVYLQILEAEPKNAEVLNKVGVAYQQIGDLERSGRFYKRSMKADKNFASAVNNLRHGGIRKEALRQSDRPVQEGHRAASGAAHAIQQPGLRLVLQQGISRSDDVVSEGAVAGSDRIRPQGQRRLGGAAALARPIPACFISSWPNRSRRRAMPNTPRTI